MEYYWLWYNQLVGVYFDGYLVIQEVELYCIKREDFCCQYFFEIWFIEEEWYNFKFINFVIEVLMEIDEFFYEGGCNGVNYFMAWKYYFDGGRVFYIVFGYKEEMYQDFLFLKQVLEGIRFVIGNNSLDYLKVIIYSVFEEICFSKQVLDFNLDEFMEFDELGDRGIIYVE